jgi:hypothetical protein
MKTNVRLGLLFVLFLVVTTPHLVSADGNASDIQCQKQCNAIPQKQRPTICPTLVCIDITNGGKTTGHCTYPVIKCKGEATSGGAGQAGGGLGMSQLLSALQGLMSALKGSPSSAIPTPARTTCPMRPFQSIPHFRAQPCPPYRDLLTRSAPLIRRRPFKMIRLHARFIRPALQTPIRRSQHRPHQAHQNRGLSRYY